MAGVKIGLALEATIMKWRVVLEQDEETGDWAIWCPELPGCASAGETEAEALENIQEAIHLYLQKDPIELNPGNIEREVAVG
jgi:predicted RNase H-like HicB family nuclease